MCAKWAETRPWLDAAAGLECTRVLVVCREHDEEPVPEAADGSVALVRASTDPADQQSAPFSIACLESCLADVAPEVRRSAIHQAIQHLDRGGVLLMCPTLEPSFSQLCDEMDLVRDVDASDDQTVRYRRSERTTVHDLLWDARATIVRVAADDLAAELAGASGPLVVDTRTHTDRGRMGVIPGSIHVPRTVLEWHLDPANGYAHPDVSGFDHPLVVVCNGGYSSSLATANLVRLGFTNARDLIGGVRSWVRHGHPVEVPDHDHLDL